MKFKIEYLLWIFILVLFFQTTAPLFSNNYHLNIDSPAHYLRLWCLDQQGVVPSNWCPHINAGNPTSQYYYPIVDQLIVLIGKITGLAFAYNLFVALSLISVGLGAYLFLKSRGYKIAPALALGLCTLYKGSWHFGGFEETILVSFWHYMLSIGFLFVGLTTFVNFLENPNKKTLTIAALTTMLFTHPMTLTMGVFLYGALIIVYYKEILKHSKDFAKFVFLALTLNAYYIIPLASRLNLFIVYPSGGYFWRDIMQYAGQSFTWYFLIPLALGLAMLYFTPKKSRPLTALVAVTFIIFLVQFFDTPLRSRLPGIRTLAFVAPIFWMLIALGVEFIAGAIPKPSGKWVGLGLAAVLIYLNFSTIGAASPMMSNQPGFEVQWQVYEGLKQLPKGRVLAEETLYNMATEQGMLPQSLTHSHSLLPVMSGHEVLGFGTYFFPKDQIDFWNIDKGNLWGKPISEWNQTELNQLFERYNVRYIIAHSPQWITYLQTLATPIAQPIPFAVFTTNTSGSWYETDASIELETYNHWEGLVKLSTNQSTTLTQKTNWYPTWAAKLNGNKVEVKDCDGFTCVDIPEGDHEVEFYQSFSNADYLGLILTLLGIIALFLL